MVDARYPSHGNKSVDVPFLPVFVLAKVKGVDNGFLVTFFNKCGLEADD